MQTEITITTNHAPKYDPLASYRRHYESVAKESVPVPTPAPLKPLKDVPVRRCVVEHFGEISRGLLIDGQVIAIATNGDQVWPAEWRELTPAECKERGVDPTEWLSGGESERVRELEAYVETLKHERNDRQQKLEAARTEIVNLRNGHLHTVRQQIAQRERLAPQPVAVESQGPRYKHFTDHNHTFLGRYGRHDLWRVQDGTCLARVGNCPNGALIDSHDCPSHPAILEAKRRAAERGQG
jgi:hypothetical protein